MKKDEQRIRELAYDIWVSEGRPHGQDERHWEMARKLAEAESGNPAAEKPASRARKTATKPTDATPAAKPAKAAKPVKEAKARSDVKPAAAAAKGSAQPKPKADTEAAEGTPAGVKKTRTPRAKKET